MTLGIKESAGPRRLGALAMFSASFVGGIVVAQWENPASVVAYHFVLVGAVTAAILAVYLGSYRSPPRTLALYFCCVYGVFHFGLAPVYLLPETMIAARTQFGLSWYADFDNVRQAHLISLAFLLGFASVTVCVPDRRFSPRAPGPVFDRSIQFVSTVALVVAIVGWFGLTLSIGAANYIEFVENVSTSGTGAVFGLVNGAIDAAFILAIMTGRSLVPTLLFLVWGAFAFTLGLRGEVAFPLLLALGILVSQRRISLPLWALAAGAAAFLALSASVAVNRVSDDAGLIVDPTGIARGLAELGGSLRPVYEAVKWAEEDGLQYGVTYYAPVERSFLRMFPIAPRPPGLADPRLMNVLMVTRAGPYGFSIAAEAYYNFGLPGTVVVAVFFGWLLSWCGRALAIGRTQPVAIGLAVGAFDHIRQSFVNGFGTTLSTLIVALGILALARLLAGNSRPNPAADPS